MLVLKLTVCLEDLCREVVLDRRLELIRRAAGREMVISGHCQMIIGCIPCGAVRAEGRQEDKEHRAGLWIPGVDPARRLRGSAGLQAKPSRHTVHYCIIRGKSKGEMKCRPNVLRHCSPTDETFNRSGYRPVYIHLFTN